MPDLEPDNLVLELNIAATGNVPEWIELMPAPDADGVARGRDGRIFRPDPAAIIGRFEENAYMMRMMRVAGHKETRILELDGYDHGMEAPAFPLLVKEVRRVLGED